MAALNLTLILCADWAYSCLPLVKLTSGGRRKRKDVDGQVKSYYRHFMWSLYFSINYKGAKSSKLDLDQNCRFTQSRPNSCRNSVITSITIQRSHAASVHVCGTIGDDVQTESFHKETKTVTYPFTYVAAWTFLANSRHNAREVTTDIVLKSEELLIVRLSNLDAHEKVSPKSLVLPRTSRGSS